MSRREKDKAKVDKWYAELMANNRAQVLLPDAQPGLIISKAEAVAEGLRWYRTGEPCEVGHTAWRYCSNDRCRECGLIYARSVLKVGGTGW